MLKFDFPGRDGRNYTARAIYECWYDPAEPDFVVINFDPDKTLMLLIFFAAIPGGILTFSCTYMCGCSRFVFVGEDGHMRLHCCGKAVTGIGKIMDNGHVIDCLIVTEEILYSITAVSDQGS